MKTTIIMNRQLYKGVSTKRDRQMRWQLAGECELEGFFEYGKENICMLMGTTEWRGGNLEMQERGENYWNSVLSKMDWSLWHKWMCWL